MFKHEELKKKLLKVIDESYDKAHKLDEQYQQKKPNFMKELDKKFDELLRPLFT